MTSKKSAILILIAVFMIGFAVGMATEHFIDSKKDKPRGRKGRSGFVEMFTRELNLNPGQVEQFKAILDTVKARHDSVDAEVKITHDIIRNYWKTEFKKILDEDQKVKYEEMDRKYKERKKKEQEEKKAKQNK